MASQPTEWAPAERAGCTELQTDAQRFGDVFRASELLNYVPDMVMILNRQRQIVFANEVVLRFANAPNPAAVLGLRPGELLGCRHCAESDGGCGTTRFCRYCGAVLAILRSQSGTPAIEECRMLVRREGEEHALDLRTWASPLEIGGAPLTFFAVVDIADEKRRRFLESIFLHDIMNTASAVRGFSRLLGKGDGTESDSSARQIVSLSDRMIEDIEAHRQLVAAENGELDVTLKTVNSRTLMDKLLAACSSPAFLNGRSLRIADGSADIEFETDQRLLRRVLGNLVKNAIEGSAPGEIVTMGCKSAGGRVVISIHNPTYVPENIRLQMFNRSFSTKGPGRGLGTYSAKVLTERYLGGRISFVSTEAAGTTFVVECPIAPRAGHV